LARPEDEDDSNVLCVQPLQSFDEMVLGTEETEKIGVQAVSYGHNYGTLYNSLFFQRNLIEKWGNL
jgi:hypothetical protein